MLIKAKILISSLSFLILCIGVEIDVHFAGSELFSISLFGEAKSCCEGPCDCCHNEGIYIVFDADYFQPDPVNTEPLLKTRETIQISDLVDIRKYQWHIKSPFLFPDSPPLIDWHTSQGYFQQFRC